MEISLRPVEDADLPAFFGWQADPRSTTLAGVPARDREAFDAHWTRICSVPEIVLRTVVANGEVVGNVVCFPRDGVQELGYWLGAEHWGRGIASAAVAAFLADYPQRPLHATVLASNAASLRVLTKVGFAEIARTDEVVSFRLD